MHKRFIPVRQYIRDAIARARYYDETRQRSDAYTTRTLINLALKHRHKNALIEVSR